MARLLTETLINWSSTPFVWGHSDCMLSVMHYVCAHQRQFSRLSSVAGTYSDESGAASILRAHGGMVALASKFAEEVGIRETETPRIGDVGVVVLRGTSAELCAIKTSERRWTARSTRGVLSAEPSLVLRSWSLL